MAGVTPPLAALGAACVGGALGSVWTAACACGVPAASDGALMRAIRYRGAQVPGTCHSSAAAESALSGRPPSAGSTPSPVSSPTRATRRPLGGTASLSATRRSQAGLVDGGCPGRRCGTAGRRWVQT